MRALLDRADLSEFLLSPNTRRLRRGGKLQHNATPTALSFSSQHPPPLLSDQQHQRPFRVDALHCESQWLAQSLEELPPHVVQHQQGEQIPFTRLLDDNAVCNSTDPSFYHERTSASAVNVKTKDETGIDEVNGDNDGSEEETAVSQLAKSVRCKSSTVRLLLRCTKRFAVLEGRIYTPPPALYLRLVVYCSSFLLSLVVEW